MKCPEPSCRDCVQRHPGCHGSCERYKTWKKAYKEYIDARKPEEIYSYIRMSRCMIKRAAIREMVKGRSKF